MRDKLVILAAICSAVLVLPLSFSGSAIATPTIARELGGSAVELNWIVNAFMLSFGSCLMAAGTLADEYGRKRLFGIGVGLFAVISAALALAPSVIWIDWLRAAQGIAAAGALSGGSAALAQEFEGTARARAFSLMGTTFGVGLAFGPVIAGFLIEHLGWRSVFLTGTVIAGLALVFGVPRMRESRDPNAAGVDWPGTLSFTAALVQLTYAVMEAPERGWGDPLVVGLLVGSIVMAAVFVLCESSVSRPMLDLSLFRYPRFVGVQALPIATCYCYVVLLVILPLRFIGIEGYSTLKAGIVMISLSAPMLFVPFLAAVLSHRFSPARLSALGLLIAAGGLLWLSRTTPGVDTTAMAAPLFIIGFGAAIPWGLMDGLSVSVVPKERAGMATGIFSTTRVAGEGLALAIVNALFAGLTLWSLQSLLGPGGAAPTEPGLAQAAQRVATGDLSSARALLPHVTGADFLEAYSDSFRLLMTVLAAMTVLSALVVLVFLGAPESAADALDNARIRQPAD